MKDYWALLTKISDDPIDYKVAVRSKGWKQAIESEIHSILKNRTWDVVDQPVGGKPITAKWIFRTKRDAEGTMRKLKARLVARGFQQEEGIDYHDIFAPVVRWSTILLILALAAKHKWSLFQLDVITAFLNGTINEDILMEIPEGFQSVGDPTKVCRINRVLYGLKQAPKAWYDRIDKWLQEQGLTRSESDPNLYFSRQSGKLIILLLYVDDLLITGDDEQGIDELKRKLSFEFEMTDLGTASNYLGVEISQKSQGLFINQRGYINKLLDKFGLNNYNPCNLPIDPRIQLQKEMETAKIDPAQYRSLVGSLLYLSHIRPDICYAVSSVSRYMQAPEVAHFQAAKKILRYLQGTDDYGLLLSPNPKVSSTPTLTQTREEMSTRVIQFP